MKLVLTTLVFLFGSLIGHAQDAHFTFHSPFGSDGTNQPGLDPETRNALVFDHVWDRYLQIRREMTESFPSAGGGDQSQMDRSDALPCGLLLEAMAELRAFVIQNPGYADHFQLAEVDRMDRILRSLNLHYYPGCGTGMLSLCAKMGARRALAILAPILYRKNGTLRPIPAIQLTPWKCGEVNPNRKN